MKKERISFHKLKSLIILTIFIFTSSCNGQENRNDFGSTSSPMQTGTQNSILEYNQSKEQISQVVRMMFQDSKGNIWFGTQNGAFRLTDNSLIHIDSIRSESGKGVTIKDIAEDKDGKIWFGHTDGISSVEGEIVKNYYESNGLLSNDVWSISADSKGNVWIGTISGVCVYDGQEFRNFELPEGMVDTTLGISSTKMIHDILEDRNGRLWFCTNAGLFLYSDKKLTHVSKLLGIQTNFVNEILEDANGIYWISTKEGLYSLNFDEGVNNITKGQMEIGKGIGSISLDNSGKLWFVSNQHYLYTYDGQDISEFTNSEENERPVIFQIYKDGTDRLWFVGFGGAYRLENEKFVNITKNGPW